MDRRLAHLSWDSVWGGMHALIEDAADEPGGEIAVGQTGLAAGVLGGGGAAHL